MDLFLLGVIFLIIIVIIGFIGYQITQSFASHNHQKFNNQNSAWHALFFFGWLMGDWTFQEPAEQEESPALYEESCDWSEDEDYDCYADTCDSDEEYRYYDKEG